MIAAIPFEVGDKLVGTYPDNYDYVIIILEKREYEVCVWNDYTKRIGYLDNESIMRSYELERPATKEMRVAAKNLFTAIDDIECAISSMCHTFY